MITRFMNVDMSLLPGEVAGVPSRLGEEERPYIGSLSGALTVPVRGKSEVDGEQDLRNNIVCYSLLHFFRMVRWFCTIIAAGALRGRGRILLPPR